MKSIAFAGTLACVLILAQAPAHAQSVASNSAVTVRTGALRGSIGASGVAVFKNIPFAQPPMGDLRWREPLPAKPGPAFAMRPPLGRACVQNGKRRRRSSEDCLQLNVWTPAVAYETASAGHGLVPRRR